MRFSAPQNEGETAALTVTAHCLVWVLKLIPMKIYNHKIENVKQKCTAPIYLVCAFHFTVDPGH